MSRKQQQDLPAAAVEPSEPLFLTELPEPRAEKRPLPIWLIVLLCIVLYWGDLYIMDHGGDVTGKAGAFPTIVYDPFRTYEDLELANPVSPEEAARNKGRQVFNFVCVACHQGNGQGLPGQFPPLAGSEWVQNQSAERIIRIVLNGLAGPLQVKGQNFNNVMPPWKGTLSDEQIAHVLSFVRNEWGNSASLVTPEEVAKVRQAIKSREAPFTQAELEAISVKAPAP
jgi:mono/diheme cytochrome c family protein